MQRLIPELAPAAIWPDAQIEELDANWWEDEELARVVRYASARETAPDEALRRVDEFIESVGEGEREERLRLLFAGLFQEINRERSRTIAAVRRYAQGQVGQLERISGRLDELERLRAADRVEQDSLGRLEQELFWQRRLFQDRQAALRALCDQSYLLEERLGRFVRAPTGGASGRTRSGPDARAPSRAGRGRLVGWLRGATQPAATPGRGRRRSASVGVTAPARQAGALVRWLCASII